MLWPRSLSSVCQSSTTKAMARFVYTSVSTEVLAADGAVTGAPRGRHDEPTTRRRRVSFTRRSSFACDPLYAASTVKVPL